MMFLIKFIFMIALSISFTLQSMEKPALDSLAPHIMNTKSKVHTPKKLSQLCAKRVGQLIMKNYSLESYEDLLKVAFTFPRQASLQVGSEVVKIARLKNRLALMVTQGVFEKIENYTNLYWSYQGTQSIVKDKKEGNATLHDLGNGIVTRSSFDTGICALPGPTLYNAWWSPNSELIAYQSRKNFVDLFAIAQRKIIASLMIDGYSEGSLWSGQSDKILVVGFNGFTVFGIPSGHVVASGSLPIMTEGVKVDELFSWDLEGNYLYQLIPEKNIIKKVDCFSGVVEEMGFDFDLGNRSDRYKRIAKIINNSNGTFIILIKDKSLLIHNLLTKNEFSIPGTFKCDSQFPQSSNDGGSFIAIDKENNKCYVYDLLKMKIISEFVIDCGLNHYASWGWSLSPCGTYMAYYKDKEPDLIFYETATGSMIGKFNYESLKRLNLSDRSHFSWSSDESKCAFFDEATKSVVIANLPFEKISYYLDHCETPHILAIVQMINKGWDRLVDEHLPDEAKKYFLSVGILRGHCDKHN